MQIFKLYYKFKLITEYDNFRNNYNGGGPADRNWYRQGSPKWCGYRRASRLTNSATTQAQIQGFELAHPNIYPTYELKLKLKLKSSKKIKSYKQKKSSCKSKQNTKNKRLPGTINC